MTTSYRDAAIALWGEAGAFAHDTYAEHRRAYFPDLPESLPIVCGITAYGKCLGLTRPDWAHGPRITLQSRMFAQGTAEVSDVLLHEMVHASLWLAGESPDHKDEPWYAAVRRLSPAVLGHELDVRRGSQRRSVRVPNPRAGEEGEPKTIVRKVATDAIPHGEVARWPVPFRPADHPKGRIIPCPSY